MKIKLSHGEANIEKLKYSGWYLHSIIIEENYRGKGIGTRLMEKILLKCDTPIYLLSDGSMGGDPERLFEFYKKFGFKKKKGNDIGYNYNMILGD